MSDEQMAKGFNAWLDDFINDPAKFEREWQMVSKHLTEKSEGNDPSYGEECTELLKRYAGVSV